MTRALCMATAAAALIACTAAAASARTPVVSHLYVSQSNVVYRYTVTDGHPARNPGLAYRGAGAPLAVDRGGDLFATAVGKNETVAIVEYPPNSHRAERSIVVQWPYALYGWYYNALSVDRRGDTFFTFQVFNTLAQSGIANDPFGTCASYTTGILAFAPGVRGFAAPSACVLAGTMVAQTVTDAQGNLFVDRCDGSSGLPCSPEHDIIVIANPATNPTLHGSLYGPDVQAPQGLAIDDAGMLYVENAGYAFHGEFVDAPTIVETPDTARGPVKPVRLLGAPSGQAWYGSIAVDAHYLYVAGGPGVLVYDRTASGTATPVGMLTLSNPSGNAPALAAGP